MEQGRIYDAPDEPPPILIAAKGERATDLAARVGDGLVGTAPDREMLERFARAGGKDKPRYGQLHVCWADDESDARKIATKQWPNTAVPGELSVELPLPRHFEQASELVTEDTMAEQMVLGPEPEPYLDTIREYVTAGYDHVSLHQVGPDQEGFFRFCEREILPAFRAS